MTPAAIVALEAFPLTPNGKVDRKALALRNDTAAANSDSAFVAPRTPLEGLVARLWCDCLQVKEVGLHDNFFELGGNSLSVVTLSLEIERATGVSLPMSFIFVSPTVFEIAKALEDGPRGATTYTPLVLLPARRRASPVFILPGITGNASDVMPIVNEFPGRMPIYGLEARGMNGLDPPFDSVDEMAEPYLDAITAVQPRGPYFLLGKCFGGLVAIDVPPFIGARGAYRCACPLDAFPHPRLWPLHFRIKYFGHSTAENLTKALRTLPVGAIPAYLVGRILLAPRNFARFVGKGKPSGSHPRGFQLPPKRYFTLPPKPRCDTNRNTIPGNRVFDVRAPYACAQGPFGHLAKMDRRL